MGLRMPPSGPMPEQAQPEAGGGQGGPAELAANVANGLEAIGQMVGSQFGEEAGNAIMQLQQQFQQIMLSLGGQEGQGQGTAMRSAQEGVAPAAPSGEPQMRQ